MADQNTPVEGDIQTEAASGDGQTVELTEENLKRADELKEQANAFFKKEDYSQAITYYTQAIDINSNSAPYYGNRSFAYLRTECFGYALQDATKALQLDAKYIKAYYRRASANMALGKFKLALKDFEAVVKVRPNDKDAKAKYTECNKIVKMNAFAKAIAVDDNKSIAETLDVDKMTIEDDYSGPRMEAGKPTQEFAQHLLDTFRDQKKLHRKYAYQILIDVRNFFKDSPSLVDITIPEGEKFTVCGDIHGQYYDLLNIFKLNGLPSESNPYLFNGDFVDRGSFSVECIITLFTFKLLYPKHFFMARGNHESFTMNQMYGFEGEVKQKYSSKMADLFTEVFNWLPLCHCINSKILVMHGGLFKDENVTLDDIRKYDRNRQPPEEGVMCELLWSDPQPQCGRSQSKRGVGTQFGPDVTKRFLQRNRLDYIIRSHEVKNDGYEVAHDGKCVTVFSAPNYCDTMGNKGAFITLKGEDLTPKFTTFESVVMHGGLFKDENVTLDDIRKYDRNRQPPEEGVMCELLWSDPQPQCGRSQSKRGVGTQFGPDVTKRFLQRNRLDYIIRSHEVKNDGYEVAHDGKCVTVFSAPNYCDTMGNKGAFITLKGEDLTPKFTTFESVPHPNVKPMQYASSLFGLF